MPTQYVITYSRIIGSTTNTIAMTNTDYASAKFMVDELIRTDVASDIKVIAVTTNSFGTIIHTTYDLYQIADGEFVA